MQSKMFGKPIDIDPDSDVPVIEQLQEALGDGKVLGRVVDIFREWDEDGSGEVSKREFAKAMSILGVDRSTLDELFDLIDVDGSGHIDYKEIYRKLRKKVAFVSRKARAARAVAMNEADAAVSYDNVRVAAADALDAKQELIRLQRQLMLLSVRTAKGVTAAGRGGCDSCRLGPPCWPRPGGEACGERHPDCDGRRSDSSFQDDERCSQDGR